jgi:hypothetical protein
MKGDWKQTVSDERSVTGGVFSAPGDKRVRRLRGDSCFVCESD